MRETSAALAAKGFLDGKPYRSGAAIFTDSQTIWSYGTHYVIAFRSNAGESSRMVYLVNEERYSATTARHRGAVVRALEDAGWKPTDEIRSGPNQHNYRVWTPAR